MTHQFAIEVSDLVVHFPGAPAPTLDGISFKVARGELVSVVGPSGAGKTTLLNCISGLAKPSSGGIVLDDREVSGPSDRLAVVFQDYSRSLFPWMDAEKNVALPLTSRTLTKGEIQARVADALRDVGLAGQGAKYPWEMSGGMQQRVAIARALAMKPAVLVMDEPMASVDAQTRADLEDLVLKVWSEQSITVLLVTHDIDEAIYMSSHVVVLSSPPTSVHNDFEVLLSRPRDQIATKGDPQFAKMRTSLFEEISSLRTREVRS